MSGIELTPTARVYSPFHPCPKCGQSACFVATKHVTFDYIGGADMLRRTCSRCGYSWDERPLDRSAA